MKRKFHHPEATEREQAGRKYWRSLDELAATPGFQAQLAREFPEGSSSIDGVDRRQFTKIMAASFALGGLGHERGQHVARRVLSPILQQRGHVVLGLRLDIRVVLRRRLIDQQALGR
jgi:molybdopterin-containing oxidoreductase family iron-sulfur binding subunit